MKALWLLLVPGILVLGPPLSLASGGKADVRLQRLLAPTKDLRATRNEVMASHYPGTDCIDYSFRKSTEKLGFVCVSTNTHFTKDMGITKYDSLPEGSRPKERPESGLLVATPMRQYEMRPFSVSGVSGVASAVVDCDTDNAANYRATSSCHVAVSDQGAPEVIYSNFVLTYHTSGKHGISERRVKEIWQSLANTLEKK